MIPRHITLYLCILISMENKITYIIPCIGYTGYIEHEGVRKVSTAMTQEQSHYLRVSTINLIFS